MQSRPHSLEDNQIAALVTSMVPFKWEEVPGKPATPSGEQTIPYDCPLALQLPPKLQFQGHQSPLFLQPSPHQSPSPLHHLSHGYHHHHHQSGPLSLSRVSPITHQKLKSLYKYLHRAPSGNEPRSTQSWGGSGSLYAYPSCNKHKLTTMYDRFFFDKTSPQSFKYSVSMDAWNPHLPPLEDYKSHDEHKSLSCLAVEDQEAESTASSPWHPVQFRDREESESPYQSTSIESVKELGRDGDEDHELFRGSFSSASSSVEKPDMETACHEESAYPSSAWFLDFSPEEGTVYDAKEGSKLVTRFVTLIKLKNIISRKVCKLRGRQEEATDQRVHRTSIWSPTLATYLYHERREESESSSPSLHCLSLKGEDDDQDAKLPSSFSVASSHGFHINPGYHLPSSILRGHLQERNDFLEGDDSSSFRVHGLGNSGSPCFSGEDDHEEEEPQPPPLMLKKHRLSLKEHLDEFDDQYPHQPAPTDQSSPSQMIVDSNERNPTPRKATGKARKAVEVLVATIKLILVHEDGKRNGRRRLSLKYGGCLRPSLTTISPLPSTHR